MGYLRKLYAIQYDAGNDDDAKHYLFVNVWYTIHCWWLSELACDDKDVNNTRVLFFFFFTLSKNNKKIGFKELLCFELTAF